MNNKVKSKKIEELIRKGIMETLPYDFKGVRTEKGRRALQYRMNKMNEELGLDLKSTTYIKIPINLLSKIEICKENK